MFKFNNVGGKIKVLAKGITWAGIVGSVCGGLGFMITSERVLGLLILLICPLCFWIFSLLIYAFGQLVENSDKLVQFHEKEKGFDEK